MGTTSSVECPIRNTTTPVCEFSLKYSGCTSLVTMFCIYTLWSTILRSGQVSLVADWRISQLIPMIMSTRELKMSFHNLQTGWQRRCLLHTGEGERFNTEFKVQLFNLQLEMMFSPSPSYHPLPASYVFKSWILDWTMIRFCISGQFPLVKWLIPWDLQKNSHQHYKSMHQHTDKDTVFSLSRSLLAVGEWNPEAENLFWHRPDNWKVPLNLSPDCPKTLLF